MRGIVLFLMLLPTVLPAAAQTTVGIRAGVGSAWLAVPRFRSAPCPPETHCPPAAPEAVRGLIFGGDLDIPVSDSSGVFGLRIGTAYAERGVQDSDTTPTERPDSGEERCRRATFSSQCSCAPGHPVRWRRSSWSVLGLRACCRARKATWLRSVKVATPESLRARGCRLRCPVVPMRVSE